MTPYDAYHHARSINKPFPEGEAAIATDAYYSYYYAIEVLNGPFPLAHDLLMQSEYANEYSEFILRSFVNQS